MPGQGQTSIGCGFRNPSLIRSPLNSPTTLSLSEGVVIASRQPAFKPTLLVKSQWRVPWAAVSRWGTFPLVLYLTASAQQSGLSNDGGRPNSCGLLRRMRFSASRRAWNCAVASDWRSTIDACLVLRRDATARGHNAPRLGSQMTNHKIRAIAANATAQ